MRPEIQAHIGAFRRRFALCDHFLLDELEKGFRSALILKQNPANGVLSPVGQMVSIHIEDLATGIVTKDQLVGELGNGRLSIRKNAGDGDTAL